MKKSIIITFGIILICLFDCENSDDGITDPFLNCQKLTNGLLEYNESAVSGEMNKILNDLQPEITTSDPHGHRKNVDVLIDSLNSCIPLTTELLCYTCIESFPPQTELLVFIDSADFVVFRIIDIITPADDILSIWRIH